MQHVSFFLRGVQNGLPRPLGTLQGCLLASCKKRHQSTGVATACQELVTETPARTNQSMAWPLITRRGVKRRGDSLGCAQNGGQRTRILISALPRCGAAASNFLQARPLTVDGDDEISNTQNARSARRGDPPRARGVKIGAAVEYTPRTTVWTMGRLVRLALAGIERGADRQKRGLTETEPLGPVIGPWPLDSPCRSCCKRRIEYRRVERGG